MSAPSLSMKFRRTDWARVLNLRSSPNRVAYEAGTNTMELSMLQLLPHGVQRRAELGVGGARAVRM